MTIARPPFPMVAQRQGQEHQDYFALHGLASQAFERRLSFYSSLHLYHFNDAITTTSAEQARDKTVWISICGYTDLAA